MDTESSFTCTCATGYTDSTGGAAGGGVNSNGRLCWDIDECTVTPNICDKNGDTSGNPAAGRVFAECHNNEGAYDCNCATGYRITADQGYQ